LSTDASGNTTRLPSGGVLDRIARASVELRRARAAGGQESSVPWNRHPVVPRVLDGPHRVRAGNEDREGHAEPAFQAGARLARRPSARPAHQPGGADQRKERRRRHVSEIPEIRDPPPAEQPTGPKAMSGAPAGATNSTIPDARQTRGIHENRVDPVRDPTNAPPRESRGPPKRQQPAGHRSGIERRTATISTIQ
jgi:hypothetical protein